MAANRVERVLQDTMATTKSIVDRVRAPPIRVESKALEAEDVGLTTGEAVSRWKAAAWCSIMACAVGVAAAVGLVCGVLVARFHILDTDRIVSLIPFMNIPDAPLNFLVVGDWGRDGDFNQSWTAHSMGEVAAQLNADFVVSTGDNFYNNGLHNISDPQFATSFSSVYNARSLNIQWYAVLGNHDYHVSPDVETDVRLKIRDWRWYCEKNYRRKFSACSKATTGDCAYTVELFFVDTSPLVAEYWTQEYHERMNFTALPDYDQAVTDVLNFLTDGLHSSDATWKVVVGHHPVFSSGGHGNTPVLERKVLPILQSHDVDVYINGHDHNLELIQMPDIKTIFVTTGAGSMTRTNRTNDIPGSSLFYHELQGFVSMSVLGPALDLRFHDVAGQVVYNVTLSKQ